MKKTTLWAIFVLVAASLACNLPFISSSTDAQEEPAAVIPDSYEVIIKDEAVLEPMDLSGAQRQVLLTKGVPNRFMLMFLDGIREETWYYDHLGYEVTFRNGEIFSDSNDAEPVDAVDFVTIYFPWQFNAEMGLSGLLRVTEVDTFAMESLEDAFQEDVSLVYLKGLDVGLRGEELLFIRTIPVGEGAREFSISVEDQDIPSQDEPTVGLTTAEAVHLGTHTYEIYCVYSDELTDEYSESVTWAFSDEGVYYSGNGPYQKIGENRYGFTDDEGDLFISFQESVVTMWGDFLEEDESGNMVQISFTCALTQKD